MISLVKKFVKQWRNNMEKDLKELLLKDLSARLPYGVKGQAKGMIKFFGDEEVSDEPWTLTDINVQLNRFGADSQTNIPLYNRIGEYNFKPYLFPLSSMTKEQKEEMKSFDPFKTEETKTFGQWAFHLVDFYNKYHFDYRGLIEKGLALDATGLNIY